MDIQRYSSTQSTYTYNSTFNSQNPTIYRFYTPLEPTFNFTQSQPKYNFFFFLKKKKIETHTFQLNSNTIGSKLDKHGTPIVTKNFFLFSKFKFKLDLTSRSMDSFIFMPIQTILIFQKKKKHSTTSPIHLHP